MDLPDRELTSAELSETAAWLGRKPWHELCLDVDADRSYQELYRGGQLSTWLIHWGQTADTGFHDHDLSAGAVHVIRGRVREERLRLDGPPRGSRVRARRDLHDRGFGDPPRAHVGDEPALTVHAYSPPLTRMGAYVVEDDGTLTRHSVIVRDRVRAARLIGS